MITAWKLRFILLVVTFSCLPISTYASPQLAEGERLIFAVDIIRHGDRNPSTEIPKSHHAWKGEFNALTAEGAAREHSLGEAMRHEYVDRFKLLPQIYQPNTVFVRSTDTQRTIESAKAFLAGLYPANFRQNLTVPILIGQESTNDLLIVQQSRSPLAVIKMFFWKKYYWYQQTQNIKDKLINWSSVTGLPLNNRDDLDALADNLNIRLLNHIPLPTGIDETSAQAIVQLDENARIAFFELPEVSKPTGTKILNEINGFFDLAIQGKSPLKYVLFSAHDATIMAVLNTLGVKITNIPPFASRLNFSLIKKGNDFVIQISQDGKPIHVTFCDGNVCTLNQWNQLLN